MLRRIKQKGGSYWKYTFGEFCVLILMAAITILSALGALVCFILAISEKSPLMLLITAGCVALGVLAGAGLMYTRYSDD